mmetsp:Transcript_42608/g.110087  ORF Transcript_42608/g.110087 Transcript_42608/m.110087 type:complete len:424 (+) Transcript_42608:91-1362(+)
MFERALPTEGRGYWAGCVQRGTDPRRRPGHQAHAGSRVGFRHPWRLPAAPGSGEGPTMARVLALSVKAAPRHLIREVHAVLDLHVALEDELDLAHDPQRNLGPVEALVHTEVGVAEQLDVSVTASALLVGGKARLLAQEADPILLRREGGKLIEDLHAAGHLLRNAVAAAGEAEPHGVQDVEAMAVHDVIRGEPWPLLQPTLKLSLIGLFHEPLQLLGCDQMLRREHLHVLALRNACSDFVHASLEGLVAEVGVLDVSSRHELRHRRVVHLLQPTALREVGACTQSQQRQGALRWATVNLDGPRGVVAQHLPLLDSAPESALLLPLLRHTHDIGRQRLEQGAGPALLSTGRLVDLLPHLVAIDAELVKHAMDGLHEPLTVATTVVLDRPRRVNMGAAIAGVGAHGRHQEVLGEILLVALQRIC